MTRDELLELIAETRERQSELDSVEVKSARKGTPRRLYESLSAFANRTGGGVLLFGLDEEHSTRNRVLMRLMEDLHLVENRGSGIQAMISALRRANLEPPRFQDKRASFWVTFHSHTLMSPEAIAWLNQFADKPLNDGQRVALAYLRQHEQMVNSDYRRLNHVDSVTATRELRGLAQLQLIEQHGTRGGAFYTLSVRAVAPTPQTGEDRVLDYVRQHGSITNAQCRKHLGVSRRRALYVLKSLCNRHLL
jgi:ATP-dependent DNA helicase RecG